LFSAATPLRTFSTSNIAEIPAFGSIIYTVFLDGTDFIYVGIGSLAGATVQDRNPRSRIIQHAQGRRSGDQFCIYIQDFYVIPAIISKPYEPKKGYLDTLEAVFLPIQNFLLCIKPIGFSKSQKCQKSSKGAGALRGVTSMSMSSVQMAPAIC